ncbi:hypothetical protein VPH35_013135 [Triticum aestivum]
MSAAADVQSGTSEGDGDAMRSDLEDFMEQLNLEDEVFDDLIIDEDDPVINESVRWLALARVHMEKSFIHTAFYKDMRAAWNPVQHVRFRPAGPKLFVVQASCLGHYERMIDQGPWLFRSSAVLMCPYDGFTKAEEVPMFFMPIWLQIHKFSEGFCKANIVEHLLRNSGKILDMRLNGNVRGDYVRIRVRHDVRLPLTKFVSIVRGKERQVFLVRYEKLARFCSVCGIIGHEYKECGSGIHDKRSKKFGAWLYADGPNKPRNDGAYDRGGYKLDQTPKPVQKTGKDTVDLEVMDTATSPSNISQPMERMDNPTRKRLAMEAVNTVGTKEHTTTVETLALTIGKGEDGGGDNSPCSSNGSKQARLESEDDRSAASLEEDRRAQ